MCGKQTSGLWFLTVADLADERTVVRRAKTRPCLGHTTNLFPFLQTTKEEQKECNDEACIVILMLHDVDLEL